LWFQSWQFFGTMYFISMTPDGALIKGPGRIFYQGPPPFDRWGCRGMMAPYFLRVGPETLESGMYRDFIMESDKRQEVRKSCCYGGQQTSKKRESLASGTERGYRSLFGFLTNTQTDELDMRPGLVGNTKMCKQFKKGLVFESDSHHFNSKGYCPS